MPDHGLQIRQRNKLPNRQGGLWHLSEVHCNSCVNPVVGPLSPRPITGCLLATLPGRRRWRNVGQCVSPALFSAGNSPVGAGETHCPTFEEQIGGSVERPRGGSRHNIPRLSALVLVEFGRFGWGSGVFVPAGPARAERPSS